MTTTYRQGTANRQGLIDLCAVLPVCNKAIEVGSYIGESAEIFITSGKVAHITCVDPFYEKDVELAFDARMAAYPGQVEKVKAISIGAFAGQEWTQEYDFIYIDAEHSYVGASWDIRHWQIWLRPGGYIGGHDYTDAQPGVVRAVNEEFGKPWRTFCDGSWLCRIGE